MPVASLRAAAFALLATCALACAGGSLPPASSVSDTASDSLSVALEQACDAALERVDALIALRDVEPDFPRDALAEARELRGAAVERYAAGDLALALDLLESAEALLEGDAE
jgi:hypothetical protein